jgi:uncharacterized membrane protein YsdA (DUF1294 family)
VKYNIGFGLPAVLLCAGIYVALDRLIPWSHYYFSWVIAVSIVTLLYYGLDKWLATRKRDVPRIPELVLNLLTIAGGSVGAWLGRTIFRHKTNLRRHWLMLAILVVSSALHVYALHTLYSASLDW